jgi:hypothetical protein
MAVADATAPRRTGNAPTRGAIRPELAENGPKWSAIQNRRNSTFFPHCPKTFGHFAVIVRGVEISAESTSIEREWRKIYTADFEYSEGKLRRFYLCRFGTLVNSRIICKWTHVWRGLLQRLGLQSPCNLDRRRARWLNITHRCGNTESADACGRWIDASGAIYFGDGWWVHHRGVTTALGRVCFDTACRALPWRDSLYQRHGTSRTITQCRFLARLYCYRIRVPHRVRAPWG